MTRQPMTGGAQVLRWFDNADVVHIPGGGCFTLFDFAQCTGKRVIGRWTSIDTPLTCILCIGKRP